MGIWYDFNYLNFLKSQLSRVSVRFYIVYDIMLEGYQAVGKMKYGHNVMWLVPKFAQTYFIVEKPVL